MRGLGLLVVLCASASACKRPPSPPKVSPSGVLVARAFPAVSFDAPLGLFEAPGDAKRLYVMERGGRVRVLPRDEAVTPAQVTTALDLSARVVTRGEGGLLGLAFHPRWPERAEVFLSFTEKGRGPHPLRSVLARFRSRDGGATFDPASEERLFEVDQPWENHNGGHVAFGPDGFLYFGLGDGGAGGDPRDSGQRLDTTLGKLLRLDVEVPAAQRYAIPPDNPFAADGVACNRERAEMDGPKGARCAEIYAWGFRNPWRWSFDRVTGELWVGDVGQNTWEEVDLVVRGGNYGWRRREGAHCFEPRVLCGSEGLVEPVVEYGRELGVSVTGGFVYRGTAVPALAGKYVFGDFSGGLFVLERAGPVASMRVLEKTPLALASFAQLGDGEVYLLDLAAGGVHRLVAAPVPVPAR